MPERHREAVESGFDITKGKTGILNPGMQPEYPFYSTAPTMSFSGLFGFCCRIPESGFRFRTRLFEQRYAQRS